MPDYWPDVARSVAECDKINGRMSRDCWPDAARILMMKTIKALHIASFNGNIGDNANHNGFRNKLKDTLGCNIEYTEVEMREFYLSWGMRDFNSAEFIDLCNKNDFIIIGGGNFFELKWDYSCTGTTVNISNETLDKINTPIFFNALGCDVAKGASKSAINKFNRFIKKIVESERYFVSVRNDGSHETIRKILGEKYSESIHKVPDGAFFFKTKDFYYPEINPKLKSIGINIVSDMKDIRFGKQGGPTYEEFIERFATVINAFLEQFKDYQIIFYPHIYSDIIAIYDLMERIKDLYRRTRIVIAPCLTGTGSEEYIFGLYKKCEFIMGMRFHSNVCAIAQNIPTIGLSSYKKIDDLYTEIGLSDRVVKVNKEGFVEILKQQIYYTLEHVKEITNRYDSVNKKISGGSIEYFGKLTTWFDEFVLTTLK